VAGGVIRRPGGGYVLGPNLRIVRVGQAAPIVGARSVAPTAVTVLDTAPAGTEIAALVFSNFPDSGTTPFTSEFTNEFEGVNYTVTLTNNAGGRVALTGDWTSGYKLVVGSTALAAGNYTVAIQVSGFAETHTIAMTVEAVVAGATLFTTTVENFDTIPSWADQEVSTAQWFKKGDVPTGSIAVITVDGVRIPQQVSNRTTWSDGSLKLAQVRFLMPVIAVGGTKTVTWQRASGSWTATDTPLHTDPAAITSKVALQYEFTSFKGRNASGTLTAERGPKRFRSADMLGTSNSTWVERVVGGPVCTEWRASDIATLSSGTRDPTQNLGCLLYARAWGGTTGNPKRIQFLFRSIQGWSTDTATDEQGLRVDLNLSVNGTVIRGAALGTTGWGAVNTWKGGFVASAGTEGTMDWFDVATNSVVTPPKIIYRHNVAYGVLTNFVPPFDVNNPAFSMTPPVWEYRPAKRGPLRQEQDDVSDHEMIPWTTTKSTARCIAANARATAAQLSAFQRYARVAGWGMGAMDGVGLHRTTRKVISYLPPTKSTNSSVLGTSIYGQGKPANTDESLRFANPPDANGKQEILHIDTAHFPQMAHWPYISEGDQHWLDLMYVEATLPGVHESNGYGFYGTSDRAGIPYGGICWRGQIRGVGHSFRPIGAALGCGNPTDPHWVMIRDYVDHWAEMTEELPLEEDAWRGGLNRTDGRRFQDLKLLWPNNEPTYKIWMHTFGLHATSYAYGISEYPRIKSRAEWWAHCPTVMSGGYHNDSGSEYYLMKPDPLEAASYGNICMNGLTDNVENRRYWYYGQWVGAVSQVTYKTDGQTLVFATAPPALSSILDGMVMTVSGVRSSSEPYWVTDNTKVPTGLTRGIPYYAVQSSGLTCKLSLSVGGSPVTFSTGGSDMVGAVGRRTVGGVHPLRGGSFVDTDANDYMIQVMAALDMYQHYVAPTDARVLLARQKLFNLKNTSGNPTGYDERGKTTVPRV
jgi:hypothetical protein